MTRADLVKAEKDARAQRMRLAGLLQLDESKAQGEGELSWARRAFEARIDAAKYEAALATPQVGTLFARGILFFRRD